MLISGLKVLNPFSRLFCLFFSLTSKCFHRYVAWNRHEQKEGEYDFTGENDVIEFIKMAQSMGLLVIVRPGSCFFYY